MLLVLGLVLTRMLLRHDSMCCPPHAMVHGAAARGTPPTSGTECPDLVDSCTGAARFHCRRRATRVAPGRYRYRQHSGRAPMPTLARSNLDRPAHVNPSNDCSVSHTAASRPALAASPPTSASDLAVIASAAPDDPRRRDMRQRIERGTAVSLFAACHAPTRCHILMLREGIGCSHIAQSLGATVTPQPFGSETLSLPPFVSDCLLPCRCAKSAVTVLQGRKANHAPPAWGCKNYSVWCTQAQCRAGLLMWRTTLCILPQQPWRLCVMGRHSGDPLLAGAGTAAAAPRPHLRVRQRGAKEIKVGNAVLLQERVAKKEKGMGTPGAPDAPTEAREVAKIAAKKSWPVQWLQPRWRPFVAEAATSYYKTALDEVDLAEPYFLLQAVLQNAKLAQSFSMRQLPLTPPQSLQVSGQKRACAVGGEGRDGLPNKHELRPIRAAETKAIRPPLREPNPRQLHLCPTRHTTTEERPPVCELSLQQRQPCLATHRGAPTIVGETTALSPPQHKPQLHSTPLYFESSATHFPKKSLHPLFPRSHETKTQSPPHSEHNPRQRHPCLGQRIGEASNPGPTDHEQRQRTLNALTQMGLIAQREETFHSPREDVLGDLTPPTRPAGANWQAQGPPDELEIPPPEAARSWLYVPLLLHAAGELHAPAASAWAQHPTFAAVWPRWVAHLRRAAALPHSRLRAATFIQAAAASLSPLWPHRAFRDLAPEDLCDTTGAVCRCRDASGYIPALLQEVLLQLYGGEAFCLELDQHLRQASAHPQQGVPEDAAPAQDLEPPEPPDTQLAAVARAVTGGRRRRRRPQRPTCGPLSQQPSPALHLRAVSLHAELRRRVLTLQAPPAPIRGALKAALRDGLERIRQDPASPDGWTLFLLAPRMLLYRQQGENRIALEELHRRVATLAAGLHQQLLDEAAAAAKGTNPRTSRKKARDEIQTRAERAAALAQLGELSAASSALTAPPLAPANAATLAALADPDRRPPTSQVPLPEAIAPPALHLNQAKLVVNLRTARRGAAAGPSGTTTEHLRVLLDDEDTAQLLGDATQCLASGDVPQDILRGLRLGRMVALQKPDGGVRGLVMSDVFRRLVGRTLAQQFSGHFNTFCAPFQYALSARAGTEALARAVRIATEANGRATVLSIDGVGAYDHISRSCMLQGLQSDPILATLSPYVRQFYGEPSEYLFYDEEGEAHHIQQGEGGEQGDPLMPALYAVGQHAALLRVHGELQAGENLFAYLDDIYLTCPPERAGALFASVAAALREAANVQVHLGKTRIWNEAGEEPSSLLAILPAAARSDAWKGNWALPTHEQGVTILGTPLGHRDFVAAALAKKQNEHAVLLQRIPAVPHLQSAWLLLLLCALPRCNYLLRALPPATTATYAAAHDGEVLRCLTQLLGTSSVDPTASALPRRAQLPLHFGGLGLRAAVASRAPAHWASWADSLPVIGARHPHLLASILPALQGVAPASPAVTAANLASAVLTNSGFGPPSWLALAEGARPPLTNCHRVFGDFARGWQRAATAPVDREALETLFSDISPASRALLLSQAGPGGSTVLTTLPTRPEYTMHDDAFRVTLLRRLRLPLPPTARVCRCGGELDILGDHRAACATAGVLVRRAVPVERTVAQICREAGGRVATDVFLRDLNLGLPITDARRLEVVANGLPSFHGAQVAVDVTLVSPIQRDACPRPGAAAEPGLAIAQAEERKRNGELTPSSGTKLAAGLWCSPSRWGAAGARRPKPFFAI